MTNDNATETYEVDTREIYLDQLAQGLAYGQLAMTAPYWERNPDFATEILSRGMAMQLHELYTAQGPNKARSLAVKIHELCQAFLDGKAPPPEEIFDALPDDVLANLG